VLGEYLVTLLASTMSKRRRAVSSYETDPEKSPRAFKNRPWNSDILLKIAQSYLKVKILVRQYSEIELQILRT
jgi:hypothetical protein